MKAWSHRLAASGMAFFAPPALARKIEANEFPQNLHKLPVLLPSTDSPLNTLFERWALAHKIRPKIIGEFDGSGLMCAFGRAGRGIFMAPAVLADNICRKDSVELIGQTKEIEQAYYAITVQRRIPHPCTEAIAKAAREGLFVRGKAKG